MLDLGVGGFLSLVCFCCSFWGADGVPLVTVSSLDWCLSVAAAIILAKSSCWVAFMRGTPVDPRGKGEFVMVVVVAVENILKCQVDFCPEIGGEVSFVWKGESDPKRGEKWVKGKVSTWEIY